MGRRYSWQQVRGHDSEASESCWSNNESSCRKEALSGLDMQRLMRYSRVSVYMSTDTFSQSYFTLCRCRKPDCWISDNSDLLIRHEISLTIDDQATASFN